LEDKNKDILKNINNNDSGFLLPESYFNDFERNFHMDSSKLGPGFIEPDNYFKDVEGKIMSKVKYTGFKTPLNYFQEIDDEILNKYKGTANRTKVYNLFKTRKLKFIGYSIAASLLLFIGLKNFNFENEQLEFETLEFSEIEGWMDNDLISFSSYDIQDTFGDITLSNEDIYTSDAVFNYLVEENIENLLNE
jgi:hypothetical protein